MSDESYQAANKIRVEYMKDKAGEYRWRVVRGRNVIGVSAEGYKNLKDCKSSLQIMGLVDYTSEEVRNVEEK